MHTVQNSTAKKDEGEEIPPHVSVAGQVVECSNHFSVKHIVEAECSFCTFYV